MNGCVRARGLVASVFLGVYVVAATGIGFAEPVMKASGSETSEKKERTSKMFGDEKMMIRRAQTGFVNMAYGLAEPANQLRLEINETDFVRGFVPGLTKGIGWFAAREAVGFFQMATFYLPKEPKLEPFNTDWLHA